jgi:hypothetical protein
MWVSDHHSQPVADRPYNPVFESPLSDRGLRRQLITERKDKGVFGALQPPQPFRDPRPESRILAFFVRPLMEYSLTRNFPQERLALPDARRAPRPRSLLAENAHPVKH